jgi:dTDP-glucose 4,6-dehydratase
MRLDDGRVVPNFILQALKREPLTVYGDGSQTRSFCYVDDLIEGISRLFFSEEHYPINIGNPDEITMIQLAEVINRLTKNDAGIVFKPRDRTEGDPQRRQPDITRARQILGWQPETELEEGLEKTIFNFKERLGLL